MDMILAENKLEKKNSPKAIIVATFVLLSLFVAVADGADVPVSQFDHDIQLLAQEVASNFSGTEKIKLAVVDFVELQGTASDFGAYLAEQLTTELFKTGRFDVIERRLIGKLLEEQKLAATGVLDAVSAQKIGSVFGVKAIVTGTYTLLASHVKVNARIVSTDSGNVFGAAGSLMEAGPEVIALMPPGTFQPVVAPQPQDQPAQSKAVEKTSAKQKKSSADKKSGWSARDAGISLLYNLFGPRH